MYFRFFQFYLQISNLVEDSKEQYLKINTTTNLIFCNKNNYFTLFFFLIENLS